MLTNKQLFDIIDIINKFCPITKSFKENIIEPRDNKWNTEITSGYDNPLSKKFELNEQGNFEHSFKTSLEFLTEKYKQDVEYDEILAISCLTNLEENLLQELGNPADKASLILLALSRYEFNNENFSEFSQAFFECVLTFTDPGIGQISLDAELMGPLTNLYAGKRGEFNELNLKLLLHILYFTHDEYSCLVDDILSGISKQINFSLIGGGYCLEDYLFKELLSKELFSEEFINHNKEIVVCLWNRLPEEERAKIAASKLKNLKNKASLLNSLSDTCTPQYKQFDKNSYSSNDPGSVTAENEGSVVISPMVVGCGAILAVLSSQGILASTYLLCYSLLMLSYITCLALFYYGSATKKDRVMEFTALTISCCGVFMIPFATAIHSWMGFGYFSVETLKSVFVTLAISPVLLLSSGDNKKIDSPDGATRSESFGFGSSDYGRDQKRGSDEVTLRKYSQDFQPS